VNNTCVKIRLCVNFKDDTLYIIQAAENESDIQYLMKHLEYCSVNLNEASPP
jgi:hypothetical protein